MSANDWEAGTIVLPSAEYAKVRQAVQQADTVHKEKVFELTQEFWKGLTRKQQTDPGAYHQASSRFIDDLYRKIPDVSHLYGMGRHRAEQAARQEVVSDAAAHLDMRYSAKPARVQKSAMRFPTNRTIFFTADDGSLSFNKETNSVTWEVSENNRAVESSRDTAIAGAFFNAIHEVRWTRGTGGIFTGNDENHLDDRSEDGGENYTTAAYGPAGAAQAPDRCLPYTDSMGRRITERDLQAAGHAAFLARLTSSPPSRTGIPSPC